MTRQRKILFFLGGFALVFGEALLLAVPLFWCLQILAAGTGYTFDAVAMFQHLVLVLNFIAFFPGQQFWTFTRIGPDGRTYVIVGSDEFGDGQRF